ncbi:hypothetical protein KP509_31G057200 [Ceratopteris richardii]|uniref:Dirigent protein n=1 Tax=Ceratopteris richardii TaxID=49495 RepID=A0A8T2R0I8_CERRI|nr:hypothetical protein KP509_31G057200 [Ceratopteris richardii]
MADSQIKLAILAVVVLAIAARSASGNGPPSMEFYMYIAVQNNSLLDNPAPFTAVQSAAPLQNQSFDFGKIHTFDNPLTTMPSLDLSFRIGRVEGWYGNTGQSILTLFLVQTFSFNTTEYNGTLSLVGVDVASDAVKYASVIGGTGDFAFARGVATQTLVSIANIQDRTVSWFHYKLDLKY